MGISRNVPKPSGIEYEHYKAALYNVVVGYIVGQSISRDEASKKLLISKRKLEKIIRGSSPTIEVHELFTIARVLGIPIIRFFYNPMKQHSREYVDQSLRNLLYIHENPLK